MYKIEIGKDQHTEDGNRVRDQKSEGVIFYPYY